MKRLALVVLTAMFMSDAVVGSEAYRDLAVYMSDATAITETMVTACVAKHPELRARATVAFDGWRQRNASGAQKASEFVAQALNDKSRGEAELQDARARLDRAKRDFLADWQRKVDSSELTVCEEWLSILVNTKSDLELLLPK